MNNETLIASANKSSARTIPEMVDDFPYVSQKEIAIRAGVGVALFRQYACGIKQPKPERLHKIQKAINEMGQELAAVSLKLMDSAGTEKKHSSRII